MESVVVHYTNSDYHSDTLDLVGMNYNKLNSKKALFEHEIMNVKIIYKDGSERTLTPNMWVLNKHRILKNLYRKGLCTIRYMAFDRTVKAEYKYSKQ